MSDAIDEYHDYVERWRKSGGTLDVTSGIISLNPKNNYIFHLHEKNFLDELNVSDPLDKAIATAHNFKLSASTSTDYQKLFRGASDTPKEDDVSEEDLHNAFNNQVDKLKGMSKSDRNLNKINLILQKDSLKELLQFKGDEQAKGEINELTPHMSDSEKIAELEKRLDASKHDQSIRNKARIARLQEELDRLRSLVKKEKTTLARQPGQQVMTKVDAYKVLGFNEVVPFDVVHKRFKELALQLHPDRNPGNEPLFKLAQAADHRLNPANAEEYARLEASKRIMVKVSKSTENLPANTQQTVESVASQIVSEDGTKVDEEKLVKVVSNPEAVKNVSEISLQKVQAEQNKDPETRRMSEGFRKYLTKRNIAGVALLLGVTTAVAVTLAIMESKK